MEQLPKWVVTDDQPAFYDTESATAIEMVAKLYRAMQEAIDVHNMLGLEKRMIKLEAKVDGIIVGAVDDGNWDQVD